ncbi:MAG: hypothetical protein AAGK05_08660, partial [Pseudomonadota bacterium]
KEGKARRERIVEKLFYKSDKTYLHLNLYIGVLSVLKEYVMFFQKKTVIIHKLHDMQMQTFLKFLSFYVKPESLPSKTPNALKNVGLTDETKFLSKVEMFLGGNTRQFIKDGLKEKKTHIMSFIDSSQQAFRDTGVYLQSKLPLNSPTLQGFSALDPLARGHSVTARHLEILSNHVRHFLTPCDTFVSEILNYNMDRDLEMIEDIVKFWIQTKIAERYPNLQKMALVSLSIFHGASVESSFNIMDDVMPVKSSQTSVDTYAAYQNVKYGLKARHTNSIEMFDRNDRLHDPIDRFVIHNIQTSYRRSTCRKENQKNRPRSNNQYTKLTAKHVSDQRKKDVKNAFLRHVQRQKRRSIVMLNHKK